MYFTKRRVGASTLFTFKFLGQRLLNLKRFNGNSTHAPPHPLTPSYMYSEATSLHDTPSDLTAPHPLTSSPVTPSYSQATFWSHSPSPPHPSLQGPFHSFFPHGFRTRTISNFSRRKMPLSPLWRGTCGRGISFQHLIVTVRNGSLIRLALLPVKLWYWSLNQYWIRLLGFQ